MRRLLGLLILIGLSVAGISYRSGDHGAQKLPSPSPPVGTARPATEPSSQPPVIPVSSRRSPDGAGYILALSWSPAWCADEDPTGSTDQCTIGGGSGLVVHGLWPATRSEDGEFCNSPEPDRLPDDLARRVRGFMPSIGLARHEWQKHGACTGLSQRDYFGAMERAWRSFRSPALLQALHDRQRTEPAQLTRSILDANPALPQDAISLICDRDGNFSEVRICLTGDLAGRACRPSGRVCRGSITLLPKR